MCGAPLALELLHLIIGKAVRLELAPRFQAALIAEGQITCLSDLPLRAVLVEAAIWDAEYFAGRDAVRLVARIFGRVEAAVGIQLPGLVSDPGQPAAFD
jgi:hypothetical protein